MTVNGVVARGLAAGDASTCALTTSGVVCWGQVWITSGALELGMPSARTTPLAVTGTQLATSISLGGQHGCAVLRDGSVRCWGHNGWGQLGDGTFGHRGPFSVGDVIRTTTVQGLTGVARVAAGAYHTCALGFDGTVRCWGQGIARMLHGGSLDSSQLTPVVIPGLTGVTDLSVSRADTCVRMTDGELRCCNLESADPFGTQSCFAAAPVCR